MKTAVSIPNDVFKKAEQFARHTKKSRSELYSRALSEYLARYASDQVTEDMDRALDEVGPETDSFLFAASHRILKRSRW